MQRPRGKMRSLFRPLMDKQFEYKSEAGDGILNLTYPSHTDVSTKPATLLSPPKDSILPALRTLVLQLALGLSCVP